jgi:hypothetical protein
MPVFPKRRFRLKKQEPDKVNQNPGKQDIYSGNNWRKNQYT